MLALFNALTCGALAGWLLWMILSPTVRDGVIVKVGLILMALGFGSIALRMLDGIGPEDGIGLARAIAMIGGGVVVVVGGYVWRVRRARHPARRATDWAELDTVPMERAS